MDLAIVPVSGATCMYTHMHTRINTDAHTHGHSMQFQEERLSGHALGGQRKQARGP